MKSFLKNHPKIASSLRHAASAAAASFALAVLPILETVGAGSYDMATTKAAIVAAAAGAGSAALRVIYLHVQEYLGSETGV